MTTLVILLFSLFSCLSLAALNEVEKNQSTLQDDEKKTQADLLASLSPGERGELLTAYQKALADPSVQSTREIAYMALHHAMLKIDPSIEEIIAKMDAEGPEPGKNLHHVNRNLGGHFQQWLAHFPAAAVVSLTVEQKEVLKRAHSKALLDPNVEQARQVAYLTFYNALLNADPLIGPLLIKVGMQQPSSMKPLSTKRPLVNEERILGGDFQAWGEEILAPALSTEKQSEDQAP